MGVLAGRVAVVTGASGGIGAALAAMLAAEGAKVVLAARREEELERVAGGIREQGGAAVSVVTDVADDGSLASLLAATRDEFGPVDVLVNNAGYAVWKPLEATTIAEWDRTFAVNVRAAALLSAAVLPGMAERGFGRIINIASEAGVAIVPGLAAYCVSKHALVALTEVIQDTNHDNGIKAWVICPGFVDTDMGYVVPGGNRAHFLTVAEVVDVTRYLLNTGDNVKAAPLRSAAPGRARAGLRPWEARPARRTGQTGQQSACPVTGARDCGADYARWSTRHPRRLRRSGLSDLALCALVRPPKQAPDARPR